MFKERRFSRWLTGVCQRVRENTRVLEEAHGEDSVRQRRNITPMGEIQLREFVVLSGRVLSMTFPPKGARRSLTATLDDGASSIELRWTGRREIPGLSVGMHLEVEGTVGQDGERFVIVNPQYRIIASTGQ